MVAGRNAPQKHVWRARIVLMTADGFSFRTAAIMSATHTAKTGVRRWQARFMNESVDELLRDKTQPPGKAPATDDKAFQAVAMTLKPLLREASHWTARAMAPSVGLAAFLSFKRSGRLMAMFRIAGGSSNYRTIRLSPRNCTMWSGFRSLFPRMLWFSRWARNYRSRHSTGCSSDFR